MHYICGLFSFKGATVPIMGLTALKSAGTARTVSVMHLAPARPDARTHFRALQVRIYPP